MQFPKTRLHVCIEAGCTVLSYYLEYACLLHALYSTFTNVKERVGFRHCKVLHFGHAFFYCLNGLSHFLTCYCGLKSRQL